jgi:hypothetical protein
MNLEIEKSKPLEIAMTKYMLQSPNVRKLLEV